MPIHEAVGGHQAIAPPPPMQAPTLPYVTLCSIIPWTIESKEFNHGGDPSTRYRFKGVAPTDDPPYRTMRLYDTYDLALNSLSLDAIQLVPRMIPARTVAEAIIEDIAGNQLGNSSGFRLGLRVIAGDRPTDTELASMTSDQNEHLRWLVGLSDRYWIGGKPEERSRCNSITYRRALEALIERNLDNADRHPWYLSLDPRGSKACPACTKQIPTGAQICENCHVDLVEFYLKRQMDPPASDPVVAAEVKRQLGLRRKPSLTPA